MEADPVGWDLTVRADRQHPRPAAHGSERQRRTRRTAQDVAPAATAGGSVPPARAEVLATLRRSEASYRALAENSEDLIARFDLGLRHLYVNAAAAAAGPLPADGYIGLTIEESGVPPDAAAVWEDRLRRCIDTGRSVHVEDTFEVDGEPHWFDTRFTPELDERGVVVSVLSVARDVTERRRAAAAWRASEDRYLRLFSEFPLGLVECRVIRSDGAVVDWEYISANRAYAEVTGRVDVVGRRASDVIPGLHERDPELRRFYQQVVDTDQPGTYEMPITSIGRWLRVHAFRSDHDAFVAVLEDVTERMRSLEALSRSERMLSEAEELASVGSWAWDAATDETTWSEGMYRLFGLKPGPAYPSADQRRSYFTAPSVAAIREAAARLMSDGGRIQLEVDFHREDGYLRHGLARSEAVCDAGGRAVGIRGTLLDVTERVEGERARRERAVLDAILNEDNPEAVVRVDLSTDRVVAANRAARELFGRQAAELVIAKFDDLVGPGSPLGWARLGEVTAEADVDAATQIVRADGTVLDVATRLRRLPDAAVVITIHDLTRERAIRAELERGQRMEEVGTIASGVAHDFTNVLTAVDGYAVLIAERMAPDDPRMADVVAIRSGLERAARLARQLMDFARRRPAQPVVIDVHAVVRRVEGLARTLVGEDHELEVIGGSTPTWVLADAGQLEQVLLNLCANSRDATSAGGHITIRSGTVEIPAGDARLPVGAAGGAYATIQVIDTGAGIEPSTLAHVFEPFYSTKPEGAGTGLGLSIVASIVSDSGGFITVDTAPSEGTSVSVHLPVVDDVPGAVADAAALSLPAVEAPRGSETVLVTEDDLGVLDVATRLLRGLGYRVLAARTPTAAIALVEDGATFDLLLTDVIMPEMDGGQLAARVRTLRPGTPVLFMTAYSVGSRHPVDKEPSDDDRQVSAAGRALTPTLRKPFTYRSLAVAVRNVLDAGPQPAHDD